MTFRWRRWCGTWALVAVVSGGLFCQTARAGEPGEALTISLLTMGPGEHPFTKFGHSAIWVHDGATGRDEVYNFGTFAFDSPTLLLDSVQGKLPYWLSVQSLSGVRQTYAEQHRSLLSSELELTAAERAALYADLKDNALPAHRYYRYDYYRDNCATRVRDVIDRTLAGRIRASSEAPARLSFREHTQRLVADDGPLYAALDLAVGRETDAPIRFWDEGFLPGRLHDLLIATSVLRDGQRRPLVRREQLLLPVERPEPPSAPPHWLGRYLRVGLALGALLAGLGVGAHYSTKLRKALGSALTGVGLVFGFLGAALCYLTFISSHSAAAENYNVLLTPPWLLLLVGIGPSLVRGKAWAWRGARALLGATLLACVVAMALHVAPGNPQQNWQELAFAVPVWLGAVVGAQLASTRLV